MNVKKLKQSNKGITLIALIVTIVILLILAGITINLVFSDNGIIKKAQEVANKMNEASINEQAQMNELSDYMENMLNEIGRGNQTEILPSDGSFNELKGVNTPDIENGALTPIVWDEKANSGSGAWLRTTGDDKNWYSYTTTDKKWANAVIGGTFNDDGILDESATGYSMFVWIPRFAYQISDNYHNGGEGISGTINIQFMKGTTNESAEGVTTWDNSSGENNWNIHPAFEYNGTKAGMWVAKFEASSVEGNTNTEEGDNITSKTLQIKPRVSNWRNIDIGNIFTVCQNYRSDLNSHLMKNSEWGAVAYLTQSSYGKNEEVWINNSSSYITGSVGNSASAETDVGTTNDYTSKQGEEASTTGNVYGIYDMSGGSWERVAAYVNNGNNNLTNYGSSIVNAPNYMKDVYDSGETETKATNYEANSGVYGDALYETSSGTYSTNGDSDRQSWYGNYSGYPDSADPFFVRGGVYFNTFFAGTFFFTYTNGNASIDLSFRPVLIID